MADFNQSYDKILGAEGGYSNVSTDLGGETYAGISRVYNPGWAGWPLIDSFKSTFPGGVIPRYSKFNDPELKQLVRNFYKKTQWDVIYGDAINSQSVADIIFDARVNQTGGLGFMVRNALNRSGKTGYQYYSSPAMKLPITAQVIADTNSVDPAIFFDNFKKERENYYKYRASISGQEGNLQGWMNRLSKINFRDIANNLPIIILVIMMMAASVYILTNNKS